MNSDTLGNQDSEPELGTLFRLTNVNPISHRMVVISI